MNVIALDLGSTTGWATSCDGVVDSGSKSFALTRFEGRGMQYLKFKRFLSELVVACTPDLIALEEVRRHLGVDAAHAYGGYLAHVASLCEELDVPHTGIPVGTIKKHATGKGNTNKEGMVAAAKLAYPRQNIIDDNQADALMLLSYVQQEIATPEWANIINGCKDNDD